jgi:hypothetical protein
MAVTSLARDGVATYAHYNNMSAGNLTGTSVFAFADATSNWRVSPDGLTWTSYAYSAVGTGSMANPNRILYLEKSRQWMFCRMGSSQQTLIGYNFGPSVTAPKFTGSISAAEAISGNTWLEGNANPTDLYFGAPNNGAVIDISQRKRIWHDTLATTRTCRPAWDGAQTWAIGNEAFGTSYNFFTTQGTSGDGIIPARMTGSTVTPWTAWSSYTNPSPGTLMSDLLYWSGYWFYTTQAGTVYRTANIATASPTWTNVGTAAGVSNFRMKVANNELWFEQDNAMSTIYKIATPTGSLTTVTLSGSRTQRGITYGNGVYIIFCGDGTVERSTNGTTWANVSTGSTTMATTRPGDFGVTA